MKIKRIKGNGLVQHFFFFMKMASEQHVLCSIEFDVEFRGPNCNQVTNSIFAPTSMCSS